MDRLIKVKIGISGGANEEGFKELYKTVIVKEIDSMLKTGVNEIKDKHLRPIE